MKESLKVSDIRARRCGELVWLIATTGVTQKIAGIDCYVSTPTGEYPKDKVVLFLTDVFGIPLINNRVCCPISSESHS